MNGMNDEERTQPLVLIVDDVPMNLTILENILRENNYQIAIANNGQEGLEMARSLHPDIVLLDVIMPDLDGFQVCEALKADDSIRDIPVVFLTARYEIENIVKAFGVGAVDYITKPFNPVEVLARVNTHLQLRKAQQDIIRLERKNTVFAMVLTTTHEISQPLTVLKGNLELFKQVVTEKNLNEKEQKFLNKIESSVEKLDGILKKFRQSDSMHFENYIEGRTMVVLDAEHPH